MRILIANRGEIARRIIRTAHVLGHETVAVYAEPDAAAPYVNEATTSVLIGPAALADSYLSVDRILDAATQTNADAIHPGYGFLSENGPFAQACIDHGLTWIGPKPSVISSLGSKTDARSIAEAAGVPTIPGWAGSQDPDQLADAAADIGYPILVKAAFGGGGKGIRIAEGPSKLPEAIEQASAEAEASFGDGSVIVERYVQRPRHIEVQVVGDKHGAIVELGTRECSVQRRYQKLLEEAPAPNLDPATRQNIRKAARDFAASIGYDSAGTVEFILDDESGDFYFLEMNTRLQVEHPVTEMITGIDLVEVMIRVATGEPLPIDADEVSLEGHAIEARILAEDPAKDFAPQLGTIHQVSVPGGVRWDSAIEPGSVVTPHYDSMIAKLIVHDRNRDATLAAMRHGLDQLIIDGVSTTAGFHRWLLDQQPIVTGRVTTRFLDETSVPQPGNEVRAKAIIGATVCWASDGVGSAASSSPWLGSSFSLTPYVSSSELGFVDAEGEVIGVSFIDDGSVGDGPEYVMVDRQNRRIAMNIDGATHSFTVPSRSELWAPQAATRRGSSDAIVAPFPAVVSEVTVSAGDTVEGDQVLVVIEAMKMLHSLRATGTQTVAEVRVAPGDQVESGQALVTFAKPEATDEPT